MAGGAVPEGVQFPTFFHAGRIADAARKAGYRTRMSAGGPRSLTAYVFAGEMKIRVANHPVGKRESKQHTVTFDVYVDRHRTGAITVDQVILELRNRKISG